MATLYRILPQGEWLAAQQEGVYHGSPHDIRDGFIHLSAPAQVKRTLETHYAGAPDLVLLTLDGDQLSSSSYGILEWEASRDGERFPHFYGDLPISAVKKWEPVDLDASGKHVLPSLAAE